MKKKEIEKIPFTGSIKAKKQYLYTVSAFAREIKAERHLFVEIYENRKTPFPWVRMVFTEKDWILYYPGFDVWSETNIEEIESRIRYSKDRRKNRTFITEKDITQIWEFNSCPWLNRGFDTWIGVLRNLIRNIKNDRLRKRSEKRRLRLEERIKNTPPLPTDLKEWSDRHLFSSEHFLYYKRYGRYADITCSACGHVTTKTVKRGGNYESQFETVIAPPKNNNPGLCLHCHTLGIYKAQGKIKGVYGLGKYCFVAQPYKESGVVVRYVEVEKIYRLDTLTQGDGETMTGASESYNIIEIARTYLEEGKRPQTDYHKYSSLSGESWDDCNLPGMNIIRISAAKIYEKSYELIKDTFLRYSGAKEYNQYKEKIDLMRYLQRYMEWPQIEMFSKMKMYGVTEAMINGECGIIQDKDATRPEKFLGIKKERLRDMTAVKGNLTYLKVWQLEYRQGLRLSEKETLFLAESGINAADISEILKYTSVTRLMHKIEGYSGVEIPDSMETGELCSRAAEVLRTTGRLYSDYLHMRIQGRYDLNNQIYMFPRDLQTAHDQMVLETNRQEMDKRKKEVNTRYPYIEKNYRKLRNWYYFEDENYLIRPARSAGEIVEEGRFLHHCVGGNNYLHKHNSGESTILFLRLKEKEKIPYITVEIKKDAIVQWYGIRDTKPDKRNIDEWLDNYLKILKNRLEEQLNATA